MKINKDFILDCITEHYKAFHPEFVITPRISNTLLMIFDDGFSNTERKLSKEETKSRIKDYLEKENVIMFVADRQPSDLGITEEVKSSVFQYFENHLPQYDVAAIFHKSNAASDNYLYSVIGKRKESSKYFDDDYACWSSWNQSTESLNFGHYNLSLENALNVLEDNFLDCTNNEFNDNKIFSMSYYFNDNLVQCVDNKLVAIDDENKSKGMISSDEADIVKFANHSRRR